MKLVSVLLTILLIISCGTVQHAVQDEVAKASVSRGKLGGQELTACAAALRQAGHKDVLRVTGGTSAYNHYTDELQYYPQFTLTGGGWGTANIKVTGPKQNPELLVLDVQRYDRQKR
jgi:hypothetical protein